MYPLYNLAPLGLGTSLAESLVSCDFRLANAHCVPVRTLNRSVLVPIMGWRNERMLNTSWSGHAATAMVTIGYTSEAWSSALNTATGRNDFQLTTLNFASGFLSTHHLHTKSARYCRECLQYFALHNKEPWIPLLWHVEVVTACPIHRTRLRTRTCGAPEKSLYPALRRVLPENCWICGRIFCLCDKSRSIKATDEEVAVAELVGELIAIGTSGIEMPVDALQLCNESMPPILGEHWLRRSAEACNVSAGGVHHMFRQEGTRTSLPGLVRFCLCNQLSLAQMALGKVEYRPCETPSLHRPWKYDAVDPNRIRDEVKKSIAAGGARSLRDLARKLHHTPKTLEEAVPDLIPALKLATRHFASQKAILPLRKNKKSAARLLKHSFERA